MMALIDDLMLYSQISLRPIEMEELDLNDTVAKVLEDLEVDIQQKKAAIKIESLPIVRGYKVQLVQLFQNLIGNALKYHQDNISPVIEISSYMVSGKQIPGANAAELKKKFFCIEVKDNGIGFEQEHSERIFQMFQRLHGISEYRGTGVGLAIARKVADNHLGRITAESEPGKGSLFRLYLPV